MNKWLSLLNQQRQMPMMPPQAPMGPQMGQPMPMANMLQELIKSITNENKEEKKGPIEHKLEKRK